MDNNWQQGNGQANGQGYQYGNGQGNGQGQQPGNGQHWNDQSQQGREQHVQQAMTSVNTLNQLTGVGDNSLGARAGLGLVDGQHGIYMFMPLKGAGRSSLLLLNAKAHC